MMDNMAVIKMRKIGYTFNKIGTILGISKQRAHQIYGAYLEGKKTTYNIYNPSTFNQIVDIVLVRRETSIRGFGTFKIVKRKEKIVQLFNKKYFVPAHYGVKFIPGDPFIRKVQEKYGGGKSKL